MKKFTSVNEQLTNEHEINEKIQKAVADAELSFWNKISEHFPEVTTGDFAPDAELELSKALSKAVQTWIQTNHDYYK